MALDTALLLNEIYLPVKFRKIISFSLGVILWTKIHLSVNNKGA